MKIDFPPLALGTWTFAGDAIWSDSDEKESIRVIQAAADMGITLFDSSPNYGNGRSEKLLGKALSEIDSSGAQVATKVKIDGKDARALKESVEQSLRNLQRETIEMLQIHWPGATPGETERALDVFMELQGEGKILNIGVCNFGTFDLEETRKYPIVSNQLPYNLLWRAVEDKIAPLSQEMGRRVWTYSAFQQGLLSGKYKTLDEFPAGRMRTRHFSSKRPGANHNGPGMERETEKTLKSFLLLSEKTGIAPLTLALKYAGSRPFLHTVLVGARSVEQLKELKSASEQVLDQKIYKELDQISEELKEKNGGNPDMFSEKSRVRYS